MLKDFSPGIQVIIFILLVVFMAILGQLVFSLSLSVSVNITDIATVDLSNPKIILANTLFSQIFSFFLSFLLFIHLSGERWFDIIRVNKMKIKPFLITLLACLLCFILLPFLEKINAPLADFLPDGFLDNEMQLNEIQEKLIIQPDTLQYIFTLILMAALPAFCEEIVFRGFLINKIKASGISNQGAIFLSAAIFAITHFQPLKFLAMFLFGVLLAIIYLRFKNIKYSMLLHFLINGIQITMGHLMATGSLPSEL